MDTPYPLIKKTIRQGNAVYIVLLAPYAPLINADKGVAFVDSFYPAHQAVYCAKKKLTAELIAQGLSPSKYQGSYKALLCGLGVGSFLKNRLVYIEGIGTFFAVEIIVLSAAQAVGLDAVEACEEKPAAVCKNCDKCVKACPVAALDEKGFKRESCLRQIQCAAIKPDEPCAKTLGNSVLGCNICQLACPLNAGVESRGLTAEETEHFELGAFYERCFGGDFEFYRSYMGSNFARKMRLASYIINAMANNPDADYGDLLRRCGDKDGLLSGLIAQYLINRK